MSEEQVELPLSGGPDPVKATEKHPDELIDTQHQVEPPPQGQTIMLIGSTGDIETAATRGNTVEHTVSMAPFPATVPDKNTVSIRVKYPANWKKDKFYKDGELREVSRETADQFVKAGFATIVKEEKK